MRHSTRVILTNSWANQCTQMPIDIPSTHEYLVADVAGSGEIRGTVSRFYLDDSGFILFSIMITATIVDHRDHPTSDASIEQDYMLINSPSTFDAHPLPPFLPPLSQLISYEPSCRSLSDRLAGRDALVIA